MGLKAQLLQTVRKLFKSKVVDVAVEPIIPPVFDKKYKIIVKYTYGRNFIYDCEMVDWLNTHSTGLVDLKIEPILRQYYIAFEDIDDALVFKIRYSI